MAKLKAILADLSGLDKAFHDFYTKRPDGKFVLDVEAVEGFALEDVQGLRSSLDKERSNVEDRDKKLKAFEGLDITKARDALEKVEKMSKWTPEEKVAARIEEETGKVRVKLEGDLKTAKEREAALLKSLEGSMIDQAATALLAEHKGSPDLLLPHIRNRARVVEKDGKFSVVVVDDKGNPATTAASNYKDPMSLKDLVLDMKGSNVYARAFDSSGTSGSGSPGNRGGGGGGGGGSGHTITKADAQDANKYRIAREAATKAGVQLSITE